MKILPLKILIAVLLFGCKSDEELNNIPESDVKITSSLSGVRQIPPNTSPGTGAVTGSFNEQTNVFTINITYSGIDSLTGWNIYKARADSIGPVAISFGNAFTSPFSFSDTLTTEQATDLKAGLYYVNIHTQKYPNGEIRGQLAAE